MKKLIILVLLAAVLPNCAPMETTKTATILPKEVAETRGSYAIVPFHETVAVGVFNKEVLKGLESAVAQAMEAGGYRGNTTEPDLLLALYVVREGNFQAHEWGYRRGWKKLEWDAYWLERRAESLDLEEGTIVIDVIDAQAKRKLWSGSAPAVLFPGAEGVVRNVRTEEAISGLLADFR